MYTLNKDITRTFFQTTEGYEALEARWSQLLEQDKQLANKQLSSTHHLLYAALRGKNWHKSYTPITNAVKIANGQDANGALKNDLFCLKSSLAAYRTYVASLFGDLVSREGFETLLTVMGNQDQPYKGESNTATVPTHREKLLEIAAST